MQTRLFFSLSLFVLLCCLNPLGCQFASKQRKDIYSARLSSLPADVKFSEDLKDKIYYDADNKRLIFKGTMTEDERDELLGLSKNIQYTAAILALYHKPQTNKRRRLSAHETDTSKSKGVPVAIVNRNPAPSREERSLYSTPPPLHTGRAPEDIQEKPEPENPAQGIEPVEKRDAEPTATNGESEDFVAIVAKQIVRKFEESFPPTGRKDFTILVKPFLTLDGKLTMFSKLLTEELFTQLSNSPWVGKSLQICCNPIDGGPAPIRLDGMIMGSLVRIGEEIKINARLVDADTHILFSSISTRIPASKVASELLEAEIAPQRPLENQGLNAKLDSLAWQVEQILHDLYGEDRGSQRLCIFDFRTLDGRKTLLGRFLAEECSLRLSRNKQWQFVPGTRVEEILGKEVSSMSDLTTADLSEVLAGRLGIKAVVEGTVTNLGKVVKVNIRVGSTEKGLTWGTASVDILHDQRIEYLLGRNSGWALPSSISVDTPKENLAYLEQTDETSIERKFGEETFLRENFSDPDVVNRLPEWGKDLIVTNEGEKNFLAAQEPRFINIEKKVDFPKNFSLEFEMKGSSRYWNTLKFTDVSGNEFGIDFQLNEGNCYVVLPGPKSVKIRVDKSSANRFKLVRKDGFYEVYINDTLALAGPYSKYDVFKSFAITARLDQIRFTGFLGKAIKG